MAAFIYRDVFLALYNQDDRYHKRAVELIKSALAGSFGRLFTSDYVVDEAVTPLEITDLEKLKLAKGLVHGRN
jgi:uncharacterized protein